MMLKHKNTLHLANNLPGFQPHVALASQRPPSKEQRKIPLVIAYLTDSISTRFFLCHYHG